MNVIHAIYFRGPPPAPRRRMGGFRGGQGKLYSVVIYQHGQMINRNSTILPEPLLFCLSNHVSLLLEYADIYLFHP